MEESHLRQITVRMPHSVYRQIEDRAKTNRRTRNGEIVILLEEAIDRKVSNDISINSRAQPDPKTESHPTKHSPEE